MNHTPFKTLLTKLLAGIAMVGATIAQANANVTFSFTQSGGNVLMQSSGVLNTSNLLASPLNFWGGVGVETNSGGQSDIMGDTSMGNFDRTFAFNAGTDYSPWIGNMFTSSNFGWSSSGTTQFATYAFASSFRTPGIAISSADMVGALWTPNVSWSKAGTLVSLGLTQGTYTVVDAQTHEAITIQIGAVPEPETYAMLIAGMGVLGAISRRRKAKQTA